MAYTFLILKLRFFERGHFSVLRLIDYLRQFHFWDNRQANVVISVIVASVPAPAVLDGVVAGEASDSSIQFLFKNVKGGKPTQ